MADEEFHPVRFKIACKVIIGVLLVLSASIDGKNN